MWTLPSTHSCINPADLSGQLVLQVRVRTKRAAAAAAAGISLRAPQMKENLPTGVLT